jgi:hypothetical protein
MIPISTRELTLGLGTPNYHRKSLKQPFTAQFKHHQRLTSMATVVEACS